MNPTNIENMLRALRPAAASPALEDRVERDIVLDSGFRVLEGDAAPAPRRVHWWHPVAWAGLGAAAAVAIMSLNPSVPQSRTAPAPVASSKFAAPVVNTSTEWLGADDEGVHFNDQKLPERHVRVSSVERREWVDPRDGAQIYVEIPREDTFVLPVNFQ